MNKFTEMNSKIKEIQEINFEINEKIESIQKDIKKTIKSKSKKNE